MGKFFSFIVFVCFLELITAQNNLNSQCRTPGSNNIDGSCIYLRSCKPIFNILLKTPLTQDDRLYLRSSQCGYLNGQPLVCCPPSNLLPAIGVCGISSSDRIYGGEITAIDEFPWMVLLEYSKPNNKKGFHCGGVLISNRYVLTASHCVNGKDIPTTWSLTGVRLGEWDTASEQDCEKDDCADPVVDVGIEEKIPHVNYNPQSKNQENDIALLRLARDVPFTEWIKPICLPSAAHLRSANYDNIKLDVAGWGKTENASTSTKKLKVRLDGVNLAACNDVYAQQRVSLIDSQLCVGGLKGKDSCRGDSGGPLMGQDLTDPMKPYWYLAGLVSFGPSPCGLEGWPGVYTRVGHFYDWIASTVRA